MTVKYWTDYPFFELGDDTSKEAPIREIIVGRWDHNKYVKVQVLDETGINVIFETEIKSGYIYTQPGRCREVPCLRFPRTHIGQY
jgi:hypothetical protein